MYCGGPCHQSHRRDEWLRRWLADEIPGGGDGPSNRIKPYLVMEQDGACAICGLTDWHGQAIGLILDHIDGNPCDHARSNVRLVCANCDMQLPTYKARNCGNGRHYRRERYRAGQSY